MHIFIYFSSSFKKVSISRHFEKYTKLFDSVGGYIIDI